MSSKLLAHHFVHLVIALAIFLGVFVCVFPEMIPRFSRLVNYAVQLMLFYLAAGLFSLVIKQPRLTFAFFGGCALLCFFLKFSVKGDGIERWRRNVINDQLVKKEQFNKPNNLKVAHVNLTNISDPNQVFSVLNATGADILSLHEVTPLWNRLLQDSLGITYPFNHTLLDIGVYGMAVYSKYDFEKIDTFYYQEVPNFRGRLAGDGQVYDFISVHTMPALDEFSKRRLEEHLMVVSEQVKKQEGPLIVFGDFNSVSWSNQIQVFLDETGLMESRIGFMPYSFSGSFSFWDIPLDHVFFSGHFVCSNFQNIQETNGQHLGVLGTYHYPRTYNAKKTSK